MSKLGVVIPLIHHEHPKSSNYLLTLKLLSKTLSSIQNSARNDKFQTLVLGSYFNKEILEKYKSVTFVDIKQISQLNPPNNSDDKDSIKFFTKIDKGMKFLMGAIILKEHFGCNEFLTLDADDIVSKDLHKLLNYDYRDYDGLIMTSGYVVQLNKLNKVCGKIFLTHEFNDICGSCRVIKIEKILHELSKEHVFEKGYLKNLSKKENLINELRFSEEFKSFLNITRKKFFSSKNKNEFQKLTDLVNAIGRHTAQSDFFRFKKVQHPLVAKVTGHENHIGPNKGSLKKSKIFGEISYLDFHNKFDSVYDVVVEKKDHLDPLYSLVYKLNFLKKFIKGILFNKERY